MTDPREPVAPLAPDDEQHHRLLLVVNPAAGGGRTVRALPGVLEALSAWGADVRVETTRDLPHAATLVAEAVADGRTPVALGGDGLAGRVAGAAADADVPVALLPGGRGNDFLRAVGGTREPVAAAAALSSVVERRLDLGTADGAAFLGIASLGFDSDVQDVAAATRLPLGGQVYTWAALRAVASWQHARFTVEVDGVQRELTGWSVAVANSPYYGGGMRYAPDALLDDGLLDVVLAGRTSRLAFLRLLPQVFRGRHVRSPSIETLTAREVVIDADRPFRVWADGDPIATLPVRIGVRPGALRLLVPSSG